MFGGLAILVSGNMAVAAGGQGGLMVRVAPELTESLLAEPGAGPTEMRDKPPDGWLRVDGDALDSEPALAAWVDRGLAYAGSLSAK